MKNIWKIVIFISVLISVVLIRECTLIPDYSSALIPHTRELSKKNYIDWDILKASDSLTSGQELYNCMQQIATVKDICLMTTSLQPVMRVYAASMAKEYDDIGHFDILCDHLDDIAEVEVKSQHSVYRRKVGDFYVHFLYDRLTAKQKEQIDSIVIFDKTNRLEARSAAMARCSPDPRYYERIRELYYREFQKNALIYLARFRKEQDVAFIQQELSRFYNPNINEALAAVYEFPQPLFLQPLLDLYALLLEDKLNKSIDPLLLFKALMSYESIKVYAVLKKSIQNADHHFINNYGDDFRNALLDVNSSFFVPLNQVILHRKALLGL